MIVHDAEAAVAAPTENNDSAGIGWERISRDGQVEAAVGIEIAERQGGRVVSQRDSRQREETPPGRAEKDVELTRQIVDDRQVEPSVPIQISAHDPGRVGTGAEPAPRLVGKCRSIPDLDVVLSLVGNGQIVVAVAVEIPDDDTGRGGSEGNGGELLEDLIDLGERSRRRRRNQNRGQNPRCEMREGRNRALHCSPYTPKGAPRPLSLCREGGPGAVVSCTGRS